MPIPSVIRKEIKIRSLNNQINYCITQNTRIGESKRAFKSNQNNRDIKGQVFSVQYSQNLRDTVKGFTNWMKTEHPEIRLAKDIRSEHIQEWINAKSPQWSKATLDNHISRMAVVCRQIENTFNTSIHLDIKKPAVVKSYQVRDVAMDKDDLQTLRKELEGRRTEAKTALEIAVRTGLRSKEIARLHSSHINVDKWVVEVREGAKNGKHRDVPIRQNDKAYFADLKAKTEGEYVCKGVGETSLNRGIRRALESIGKADKYPNSTTHAIRKMYATERMQELRKEGKNERTAWSVVQQELGHGSQFRQKLYSTYVKG